MVLKNYLGCFAQKKTLGRDSAFGQELAGSAMIVRIFSTPPFVLPLFHQWFIVEFCVCHLLVRGIVITKNTRFHKPQAALPNIQHRNT